MILESLAKRKLISPPEWMISNVAYLTIMGSTAYGVADTNSGDSDWDIYGFCIPPKTMLFPHLKGEILGFGKYKDGIPNSYFRVWQQHHVYDPDACGGKGRMYDFQIYNIVPYVHLCCENNPNMIDSLFTAEQCVLHNTSVANLIRDNRKKFLTQEVAAKFKGYAYSQVKKLMTKEPQADSNRAALVEKYGWDVKFGYQVVRLAEEAAQILSTGDLDLMKSRELLKSIRRGEWTLAQMLEWFEQKRIHLEELLARSTLPTKPNWTWARNLLHKALEMHYGDLSDAIFVPGKAEEALMAIKEIVDNYK